MRRALIVFALILVALAMSMASASGIVHNFTPTNECASSGNAGGVSAAGSIPFFSPPTPVPVTASDGAAVGQAEGAAC